MKKILKDKRIIVVVIVIVLVLLLLDFNQRMVLLSKLRGQEKQLTQEYGQLLSTVEALKTEIVVANSDDAVEKWAREEAGMVQEGDIPIVLLPASDAIPNEPTPQPVYDPLTQVAVEIAPQGGAQRWRLDSVPMDVQQQQCWERIKTERDRRKSLGVKVGSHWFHSDDASRIQQLALVMMGQGLPAAYVP